MGCIGHIATRTLCIKVYRCFVYDTGIGVNLNLFPELNSGPEFD